MTAPSEITNQAKLSAGWRRGYAADCKSLHFPRRINENPQNRYQIKPGTPGERDNRAFSTPNPIQAFAKPAHKSASKLLGYGLILDTPEAWQAVASVWAVRLTTGERAAILMAALHSLRPDQAAAIIDHAFAGVLS